MSNKRIMELFFLFLDENRSRYEEQAQTLLSQKKLETQVRDYKIKYTVEDGTFSSTAKPVSRDMTHFGFEVPIPESSDQQIEELIELFAKSEAVCVSS